jgi:hypothetical protein
MALSPTFAACQVQKPVGISPLWGCPPGTILVSGNVSVQEAKFRSIQDAILSLCIALLCVDLAFKFELMIILFICVVLLGRRRDPPL